MRVINHHGENWQLLWKKPAVGIGSGHLSALLVWGQLTAVGPPGPCRGCSASCSPTPRWAGVLVIVGVAVFIWFVLCSCCFAFPGTGVGVFVSVLFYSSDSFYKSLLTANRPIVWNNQAVALILLSYQDFFLTSQNSPYHITCGLMLFCTIMWSSV